MYLIFVLDVFVSDLRINRSLYPIDISTFTGKMDKLISSTENQNMLICRSSVTYMTEYEQMVIMKELLVDYDADFRAQIHEPLNISTNMYVQMLSEIDQTAMDYEMTIFFR